MAATDLNAVRGTIEKRLLNELSGSTPPVPIVFHNTNYTPPTNSSWCQCQVEFSTNDYLTQGGTTDSSNRITGAVTFNIYSPKGIGSADNLAICKKIRDLYNRVVVSGVYFDPVSGPEVMTNLTVDAYFQTQINVTFEVIEEL